jgi:hypothetical protein
LQREFGGSIGQALKTGHFLVEIAGRILFGIPLPRRLGEPLHEQVILCVTSHLGDHSGLEIGAGDVLARL